MSRIKWLCLGGLLIIVIVVCCRCWRCPFCPRCPTCPECVICPELPPAPAATLVLEDMHIAAWMPIDNEFVSDPGTRAVCQAEDATDAQKFGNCTMNYSDPENELRLGVLFQIGHLDLGNSVEYYFDKVTLTRSSGPSVDLNSADFDWLDINTGSSCAIDPLHAYSLFQSRTDDGSRYRVTTDCDGAVLAGPACTGAEPLSSCCDGAYEPCPPQTCLRERSIHAGLVPDTAIVTYWPGALRYTMDMVGTTHDFGYVFKLQDPVTVDRWRAGCFIERYEDVTEIRITSQGSAHHHGFPHAPMDGGRLDLSHFGPEP